MKTASILIIATLALASQAIYVRQDKPMTPEESNLDEVVQAARGFFFGFQSGLYKTTQIDENCLNKEAEGKVIELFDAVFQGRFDLGFIMSLVTDFMTITSSLQSCSTQAITDLASFCFFTSATSCTPGAIIQNAQSNLLIIMSKMTDLSTIVMQGIPKDAEQAYNMGTQAGQDIGSLIRVIIGFKN